MKKPGLVLTQLLILLGYSAAFIAIAEFVGDDAIGPQWAVLLVHFVVLIVLGAMAMRDPSTKPIGKQYFIAALLVLLIGHGLCFFNGLLHFNLH